MRILVYSSDIACAQWVRDTLNDFGRGMHITIASSAEPEVLNGKWAYIIILGEEKTSIPLTVPYSCLPLFANPNEQEALRRNEFKNEYETPIVKDNNEKAMKKCMKLATF
mgnify:CR=1 FL=1